MYVMCKKSVSVNLFFSHALSEICSPSDKNSLYMTTECYSTSVTKKKNKYTNSVQEKITTVNNNLQHS